MSVVPFNRPFIVGKELFYIAQAVTHGALGGDAVFTRRCAKMLEISCGAQRVLLTPSCTAALEMATILLDLNPGDEVIMPSFTFVSTASAVVRAGGRPVFVDVRADTLNLDEALVEQAITPRTRAMLPIHYAGVGAEMDTLCEIAEQHGLVVIEDAAQGVNAAYRGRGLGSIGAMGTFSFHETKNVICGEGGALCINDPSYIERAEIIRDKGTNRQAFFRGDVDKYTWVDVGSSYVISELCSAFLLAQLEATDRIQARRRELFDRYCASFRPLEAQGLLRMPDWPPHCQPNYHIFYLLLNSADERDRLIASLRGRDIMAVFHYVPLHSSPMGRQVGRAGSDLARTDDLSSRLLRLPLFYDMSDAEQERVIEAVFSHLD